MRITAGSMRGRIIHVPNVPGLRPTPSKVRQALFNILGPVCGFRVLDLFAGSGIMALEALSRGAASALSVEQHHRAVKAMQQSRNTLDASGIWTIQARSVGQSLAGLADTSFDLIFADPPYAQGHAEILCKLLTQHDIACGQLIIEESSRVRPGWPEGWICQQSRRYGDTCLHFLARK
ncbi:MAG: 16S rRNA (guanine(966)-N(2))-methyltransferase RsmD [Mariprofundus sp.]